MDRWKFVNEKWIPRPVSRGKGYVLGIAAFSFRSLPHWGRLCVGDTAFPIQPPPLRGTSFLWKEGMTTRAPSLGRGCRARRGGVGFLFCGEAASSLPSPSGKGDRAAVDRVLSYIVDLRRISPLVFHHARTLSGSLCSPPSPWGKAAFVVAMVSCKDGAAYKSPGIPVPISPAHVRGLHRRF